MSDEVAKRVNHLRRLRDSGNWISFMDEVTSEMPFLLSAGRPRQSDIADSIIGQSGWDSWAAFCEIKLLWSIPGWHAWTKAYREVQKYPYLREAGASASLINVRRKECKAFPENINDWKKVSLHKSAVHRESKIAQLERRLSELEKIVSQLVK